MTAASLLQTKTPDQFTAAGTLLADDELVVRRERSATRATRQSVRDWLFGGVVTAYASGAAALRAYADGFYALEVRRASADANPSALSVEKSRGTIAAPAAIQAADALASMTSRAWDGAAWTVAGQFRFDCRAFTAAGDFTTAFLLQLRNGASTVEVMRVLSSGEMGVGTATPSTTLHVAGPIRHVVMTVAGLPAAATVGAGTRAAVTDAASPTFGALVSGGGAVFVPVISDGTAWRVG